MNDILRVADFEDDVPALLRNIDKIVVQQSQFSDILKGKLIGTLFIEPSTRTRLSFEAAAKRLGADVIKIDNPAASSIEKGESFQDTIRTMSQYVDLIVIRSNRVISDNPRKYSRCPVINAGDSSGEHPTQALTDLYTVYRYFPRYSNINIAITGDLMNGRAAKSVIRMFSKFTNHNIFLYSYTGIPEDIINSNIIQLNTQEDLVATLPKLDVLYMTRFQKERVSDVVPDNRFSLTLDHLSSMKPGCRIMHPLPRLGEIPREIDADPRAIYFEQVQNGMYVRMVLLANMLNVGKL